MLTSNNVFEIIQELHPDVIGVMITLLQEDDIIEYMEFGDIPFMTKIGMLESHKQDLLQQPREERHLINYHDLGYTLEG